MVYSIHPYDPYIPESATKLIIGTIPPPRFCTSGEKQLFPNDVDFYYGSRENSFWKLLSEVTGVTLDFANTAEAVNQRKQLLSDLNMGITDTIQSCVHRNGSADDASLESIKLKPLDKLLLEHPNIRELFYTDRNFVKTQINHAFADKGYHDQKNKSVLINGKKYAFTQLYSPSPNALRSVTAEVRLQQYKDIFKLDSIISDIS